MSRQQYGRIERGELRSVPLGHLDRVCMALGADLDVRVRWHGEGLDRLLDAAHADLVNRTVRLLTVRGWTTAVEVSFSRYGERGSVDVIGWHAPTATLLVVEVKSVVPDVQAMIAAHDRKARLGGVIGRERGWDPRSVGRLLIVADGATARSRVREFADLFAAAYPQRAVGVRRWLRRPLGPLAGLMFLHNATRDGATKRITGRQRVRSPHSSPRAA